MSTIVLRTGEESPAVTFRVRVGKVRCTYCEQWIASGDDVVIRPGAVVHEHGCPRLWEPDVIEGGLNVGNDPQLALPLDGPERRLSVVRDAARTDTPERPKQSGNPKGCS